MSELDTLDGERGIPAVSESRSSTWQRSVFAMVVMAVAVVALGMLAWRTLVPDRSAEEVAEPRTRLLGSALPSRTFVDLEPEPEPEPVIIEAPTIAAAEPEPEPYVPIQIVPAASYREPVLAVAPPAVLDKTSGAMLVSSTRTATTGTQTATSASSQGSALDLFGGSGQQAAGGQSNLSDLLSPTRLEGASAARIGDQNMLLAQGGFIDCVLQTKLVSTAPGLATCKTTSDVYSVNGNVRLIEQGSTVTGEYRANLKHGQSRIFVLWNRIRTDDGVVIDLNSPATGPLGATGLEGAIDSHFWQRFGGAFLLSLVDDVVGAATRGNTTADVVIGAGGSAGGSLAEEVLRQTINIPPTLYKNQGERVGIYVARDLDFSTVYGLQADQ